jgi:ATP-dependent protease ClpP protease subunit
MTKTIRIDGVIGTGDGEISAAMVREQLPQNGADPIAVKIHSEGGSVFEGFAIHDAFAAYQGPKSLSIESSAFSIASFIACAFDDVEISSNGYMMLHNPYAQVEGDDEDFARQSEMLGKLKSSMVSAYAQRSGKSEDEIKAILKNETYLNAQQSVEMGLAKRIAGQPVIGRPFAKVKTMPHGVVAALFGAGSGGDNDSKKGQKMPESTPVAATLQEIEAAFPTASEKFIVKCLRRNLPLASVATAAAEEMMSENEELKKQVSAIH